MYNQLGSITQFSFKQTMYFFLANFNINILIVICLLDHVDSSYTSTLSTISFALCSALVHCTVSHLTCAGTTSVVTYGIISYLALILCPFFINCT